MANLFQSKVIALEESPNFKYMTPDIDAMHPMAFMQWLQGTYPALYVKCSEFLAGLDDRQAIDALRKCVDMDLYQAVVDARFEFYHKIPKT